MSRGLQWQIMNVSLGGGLETKEDVRAADARQMDVARDVIFEEFGGVQTRFPYTALGSQIFGGGTITNARRIEANGDELVLFTDTQVYSWNAQLSRWLLRGTHLAVQVTETPEFTTNGDQLDCDRAELNGTVFYSWADGTSVYTAALDKTTGAVLMPPTSAGSPVSRPRLVATSTTVMLFIVISGLLRVSILDPANPAAAILTFTTVGSGCNGPYDVVKIDSQDAVVGVYSRTPATSYTSFIVTSSGGITNVTKGHTADGPMAVSSVPGGGGAQVQVIRSSGTNIQGDLLATVTLGDVFADQPVGTVSGTPVNQIACAHRTVQNAGAFRCYAFWDSQENAAFGLLYVTKSNFVDNLNTIGTQAPFINGLSPGSRAFPYAGNVYLWVAFGQNSDFQGNVAGSPVIQAQNAYLLYRDDAFLAAKCVYNSGGGLHPSKGYLPNVALTSGTKTFSWAATKKRIATLGGGSTGYAARAVQDVTFTFDSNAARRCARIGRTMYVAAGEILQYDGTQLVETGFHFYPYSFDMLKAGTGNVANGTYAYKLTARWLNAQGESERSTTATIGTATMAAGPGGFTMGTASPLTATHKAAAANPIGIEVWRTTVNPQPDNPFYLATDNNPTNFTSPNQYVANDPTSRFLPASPLAAWRDEIADLTLSVREVNPENGAILEALAPPAASIIITTDTRVFLAGVAGDADSVWYSRQRQINEIASFNDGLTIPVPPEGGDITALAFLNETLVVFRQTCIYALPGVGFDNGGGGSNFGPSNRLSSDVGAISAESVALTPAGLIFKSLKGWYLVLRSWECKYIGANAESFDGDTVLAIHVVDADHQVRILTNARVITWDYIAVTEGGPSGQWSEWTIPDGVHATLWNGVYTYLTTTGPKVESPTYTALTYGIDVESSWIKLQDLQGASRVRWIEVLGEFRSTCFVRLRVARDYQYDASGNALWFDDVIWSPSPAVIGSALQLRHALTQGNVEALKVRVTAVSAGSSATLVTSLSSSFTPLVATSGTAWNASLFAGPVGSAGNAVTLSIAFEDGAPFAFDVREHFIWSHTLQRWTEKLNNVGVKVTCRTGSSPTVAQLENAFDDAGVTLFVVSAPDPSPTKIINATAMANLTSLGTLSGGSFGTPTGEAIKLTGLGLEVGLKPGLFRRLPAAQKV